MPNTSQWNDPNTQVANTGPNTEGVYLIDPVTRLAISPAQASGGDAVTIADGADVAEGSTTDAAVTGDNSGTVNAHLRGLTKVFVPVTLADGLSNPTVAEVGALLLGWNGTNWGRVLNAQYNATGNSNDNGVVVKGDVLVWNPVTSKWDFLAKGVANMAGSLSVTIASDQTAIPTLDTNSAASKSDLDIIANAQVGQGSTTSGQNGPLVQGAVTTASPTYTNGQTSPISLTPSGGLRAAQSGNWTVLPGNTPNTTPWLVKEQAVSTFFIAAGTAGNTVVKGTPGTFYGVFASTVGAGGGLVYDNATTNSGTPVGVAPTAVGFDQGVPAAGVNCVNGITVAGGATNPALTVFYL